MISVQESRRARRFDAPLSFAEAGNSPSLPSGVATRPVIVQRLQQNVNVPITAGDMLGKRNIW